MKLISKRGSTIEIRSWGWTKSLYINGYPQSQPTYRRDWTTVFRRAKIVEMRETGSALILGLGGGDMAQLMAKVRPNWQTTYIEIDSDVVQIAREHFGVRESEQRQIVVADAKLYLAKNRKKFDLIIVDIYDGDTVPAFVRSAKFLSDVARSLKQDGKVLVNYASHSFGPKDFDQFARSLCRVFRQVNKITTWGHTYYLASF